MIPESFKQQALTTVTRAYLNSGHFPTAQAARECAELTVEQEMERLERLLCESP